MKQIDCSGLVIRDTSGTVVFDTVVDLLIGDEQTTEYYDFQLVVVSLPELPNADFRGAKLDVWDTTNNNSIVKFQVERAQFDFQRGAQKLEGKHYTATRWQDR